jgi:hypothetical protein
MEENKLIVGHVLTVDHHTLVKDAFKSKAGVAGVIFPFHVDVPFPEPWQEAPLREKLSLQFYQPDGIVNNDTVTYEKFEGDREWTKPYVQAGYKLLNLADSFNRSSRYRYCKFVCNDALNEFAHIDKAASQLWVHWHICGQGMEIYVPTGDEVVMMDFDEEFTQFDDSPSPEQLGINMRDKKLRNFHLKVGQAIAFNDTLLHASASGQRFRCFVS